MKKFKKLNKESLAKVKGGGDKVVKFKTGKALDEAVN